MIATILYYMSGFVIGAICAYAGFDTWHFWALVFTIAVSNLSMGQMAISVYKKYKET